MKDDMWTVVGRGLAQASAQECIDSPPLFGRGRFRSLVAESDEFTVVVATVVVPKDRTVEQVVRTTAEAVRRALVGEGGT